MSEKSIPGRRRIGRPLLPARPPRADDADAFAIDSPPHGIGHDEHAARRRAAQSQEPRLPLGVMQVRAVQGIRIAEHGRGLFEQDPMLRMVDRALPRVPLEHDSVYTKLAGIPPLQASLRVSIAASIFR